MSEKERIEYTLKLLSMISVRGDDVERMAVAKKTLRDFFGEVKTDG